ncbi:MAG: hypothetical protein ACXVDA_00260 [Ktedonobacterales bacterium]
MSGFERANSGGAWTEGPDAEEPYFPDDFSVEEAAFASELRELFALEREELPPLYAQTLLHDERLEVAEAGFEQKLLYRVMRRLRLQRAPLFEHQHVALAFTALRESLIRMSRPLAASLTTVMFVMALTVAISTPSFAAGVRILLGQTGVQQVPAYPTNVRAPIVSKNAYHPRAFDPGMPVLWLGSMSGNYLYQGVRPEDPTDFSQGPIVEMQYTLEGHTGGTGVLDIREFRINEKYSAVLQVIQDGSQSLVNVGDTPAVYVDGTWVTRDANHRMMDGGDSRLHWQWQLGVRSELIFERDGVVYWIVGDQRDGMNKDELIRIASLLKPADARELQPNRLTVRFAGTSLQYTFSDPVGHEVYAEVASGDSPGTGTAAFVSSQGQGAP